MKQIIITVLAVVAIVGGAVLLGGGDDTATGQPSNNIYGNENGQVTVVEYADFECPACASFYPTVAQVKEQFKDQVRFEFRHFPLVQIHQNAQASHRAAQAAANQGKFWEMHDLLFQRQSQWAAASNPAAANNPAAIFEGYAQELGLDMEQFNTDVAASETLATINSDIDLGKQAGVTGTPSFFIDGVLVEDTSAILDPAEFAAQIQAALDSKAGVENEEEPADSTDEAEAKPEEDADSSE